MRELRFFDYGLYPFENSDHEVSCRASRRGWTVGFFFINATIRCYREGCRRSPRHGDKTYGLLPQTLLLRQSAHMEKAKAKQEGVPHRGGCLLSNKRSLIEQLPRFERRLVATARHWADVMPQAAAGGVMSINNATTVKLRPATTVGATLERICAGSSCEGRTRSK
eukprot:7381057-Prymnesium_polylepis.2